jgi:hypothetical protein
LSPQFRSKAVTTGCTLRSRRLAAGHVHGVPFTQSYGNYYVRGAAKL